MENKIINDNFFIVGLYNLELDYIYADTYFCKKYYETKLLNLVNKDERNLYFEFSQKDKKKSYLNCKCFRLGFADYRSLKGIHVNEIKDSIKKKHPDIKKDILFLFVNKHHIYRDFKNMVNNNNKLESIKYKTEEVDIDVVYYLDNFNFKIVNEENFLCNSSDPVTHSSFKIAKLTKKLGWISLGIGLLSLILSLINF